MSFNGDTPLTIKEANISTFIGDNNSNKMIKNVTALNYTGNLHNFFLRVAP